MSAEDETGSDDSIDLDEYTMEYVEKQQDQGNELVEKTEDGPTDPDELRGISLGDALQHHKEVQRSKDRSEKTIKSHRSRLKKFCAWLNIQGVDDTLDITRRHFEDYRKQRSKNVKSVTVKTHMDTIRVFIRNLEDYQAVPDNLSEHVRSPDLQDGEGQRSDHLPVDRGDTILENVRKYMWGSLEHVVYELWWASGIRLGGVHSIDEDDVYLDERYIEVRHRPDEGTTLKNQSDGERDVSITPATADAIEDYLDNPERPDVRDENGRNPLLASPHNGGGRYSKSHLRNICYHLTLPCVTEGGECPHDKEPQECDYRANKNKASQCPSSKAPHALRSGALTRQLKRGVNPHYISERANVGVDTLEEHYNELSKKEKMEVRRQWFDEEFTGKEAEEKVFGDDEN